MTIRTVLTLIALSTIGLSSGLLLAHAGETAATAKSEMVCPTDCKPSDCDPTNPDCAEKPNCPPCCRTVSRATCTEVGKTAGTSKAARSQCSPSEVSAKTAESSKTKTVCQSSPSCKAAKDRKTI